MFRKFNKRRREKTCFVDGKVHNRATIFSRMMVAKKTMGDPQKRIESSETETRNRFRL